MNPITSPLLFIIVFATAILTFGNAFAPSQNDMSSTQQRHDDILKLDAIPTSTEESRRDILKTLSSRQIALSSLFLVTQQPLFLQRSPPPANAAMEKIEKLTLAEAENRLREGRKSAQYLLDHYDKICEGGGDNVRRYLGTVGTTSGLLGIDKAMKLLAVKADDIVEYTELSDEINKCIQQADGSAYMAIFVTTSTSYTPPAKYFADAKVEIKRLNSSLDQLAALIDVKF